MNELTDGDMEKPNRLKGRDVFVDEETCAFIHSVNSISKKTPEEWEELGIFYRHGRWTKSESERLLENWVSYLKENPSIVDPNEFFDRRHNREIIRFAHRTGFYIHISKTLNRSTFSCYSKLDRMVHRVTMKTDTYSKKEIKKLKKYIRRYGFKSQKIADKMGRNPQSITDKYRTIFKEVASGKWTENEDQTLVTALKNVTGVDDISKLKCLEIPWRKVAEQVPSRHEEQCRSHFLFIRRLKFHENLNTDTIRWRKAHKRQLIEKISEAQLEVETDIDWVELHESFKGIFPSPHYLRTKFIAMKIKIKDYQKESFPDLIDIMAEKYIGT